MMNVVVIDLRGTDYQAIGNYDLGYQIVASCRSFEAFFSASAEESRWIHTAFLASRVQPAFKAPDRAYPRETEVIREPCQLVKQCFDASAGIDRGPSEIERLNLKNAGKSPDRAFALDPAHPGDSA